MAKASKGRVVAVTIPPLLVLVGWLARYGITSWGCAECPDTLRMVWAPPSEGSPAVAYVVEVQQLGLELEPPAVVYCPAWCDSLRGRVAGVDSLGRTGPWSEWSAWHYNEGRK